MKSSESATYRGVEEKRRWSEGIQHAVEATDGLKIQISTSINPSLFPFRNLGFLKLNVQPPLLLNVAASAPPLPSSLSPPPLLPSSSPPPRPPPLPLPPSLSLLQKVERRPWLLEPFSFLGLHSSANLPCYRSEEATPRKTSMRISASSKRMILPQNMHGPRSMRQRRGNFHRSTRSRASLQSSSSLMAYTNPTLVNATRKLFSP